MDNQKLYDSDAFVALPPIHDGAAEPDTVVFTCIEWEADDEPEVFGVRKVALKAREKTPGVKAVLVFRDSFLRTRQRIREYTFIRLVIDLLEIVSATIDVCDADPAVTEKVGKRMLERRA